VPLHNTFGVVSESNGFFFRTWLGDLGKVQVLTQAQFG